MIAPGVAKTIEIFLGGGENFVAQVVLFGAQFATEGGLEHWEGLRHGGLRSEKIHNFEAWRIKGVRR
jgi:hypothetical protein